MNYDAEALRRHRETRGKVGIYTKMPLETRDDLSVAYTPGVAAVRALSKMRDACPRWISTLRDHP